SDDFTTRRRSLASVIGRSSGHIGGQRQSWPDSWSDKRSRLRMSQFSALGARRAGVRRLRLPVILCLGMALAFVWALVGGGAAQAMTPAQPALPALRAQAADSVAQQAVQLDSPAVVRIVSVVNASLTCSGCASDGSDIHSPSDGSVFTYYSSGSGAFITPGGAILTADHVVDHSLNNR